MKSDCRKCIRNICRSTGIEECKFFISIPDSKYHDRVDEDKINTLKEVTIQSNEAKIYWYKLIKEEVNEMIINEFDYITAGTVNYWFETKIEELENE